MINIIRKWFNNLFSTLFYIAISTMIFLYILSITYRGKLYNFDIILKVLGIIGFCTLISIVIFSIYLRRKKSAIDFLKNKKRFLKIVDEAKENHNKLLKKIKILTLLGNIYIIILLSSIILTVLGIFTFSMDIYKNQNMTGGTGVIILSLFVLLNIILESLYITKPEEDGIVITEKEFPEIYEIIARATAKTNSKKIDKIYVYPHYNCGIKKESYKFGLVNKNELEIGMYLLEILTESEIEAVIIHELSHINNKDTVLSNKISKIIIRWTNIFNSSNEDKFLQNLILIEFAKYYINELQMYFNVINKNVEILADKEAVKYASKKDYYFALLKCEFMDIYMNKYSDNFNINLYNFKNCPNNFYNILFDDFYKNYENYKEEWKNKILKMISIKDDTHPSFLERMKYLGINEYNLEEIKFNKNKIYKKELEKIIKFYDDYFYNEKKGYWYEYIQQHDKLLEIIKEYDNSLDVERKIEIGNAFEELYRLDDAVKIYDEILEIEPDNAIVLFKKGLILLYKNDIRGIEVIKKSIELDTDFIEIGVDKIEQFLYENGLKSEKENLLNWFEEMDVIYNNKIKEESIIHINDVFLPHGLEEEKIKEIQEALKRNKKIKKVYLLKKELKFSNENLLILAVCYKGEKLENIDDVVDIFSKMNMDVSIFDLNYYYKFNKRFKKIENSLIFYR